MHFSELVRVKNNEIKNRHVIRCLKVIYKIKILNSNFIVNYKLMFDPILYTDLQYIGFEITSSKIRIDNGAVVSYFILKKTTT